MAIEIERKFLVAGDYQSAVDKSEYIVQGYICADKEKTVRVRIRATKGYITIKGESNAEGLSRYEFEQEIPLKDAEELLKSFCENKIEKRRNLVSMGDHVWEVDEFLGENEGLVMAEIELKEENEPFEKPDWLGVEVTGDKRYYNSMLLKNPYKKWRD